jgi:hypothetical protein
VGGDDSGVEVEYERASSWANLFGLLLWIAPLFVLPFVMYYAFLAALRKNRREQGAERLSVPRDVG